MAAPTYAVVQAQFDRIEPEILSAALSAHVRWPRADIQRLARKARGILGTTFSDGEARGVCQALSQAGFAVRAIATDKLLQLPRPRQIAWLDIAESALGIPLGDAPEIATTVPWSSVFVIHATTMATDAQQTSLLIGDIVDRNVLGPGGAESTTELHPTMGLVGVAKSGEMVYVRLTLRRFHRQFMPWIPAGAVREQQFRAVLGALIARSPVAVVGPDARKMVVQPVQDVGRRVASSQVLPDERAFQSEMNWMMQLLAFQNA